VTNISGGFPAASIYTVQVTPSGSGTIQLQVQGTIEDSSGNDLTLPVTDAKVFTFDTGVEPARETVTLDASTTSNSTNTIHTLVFDASASDKLVVIVTGENGNPGLTTGAVNSLSYDGVPMTKAVGRLPIGSPPSAFVDQLYNDIWYLDDPAAATASASASDPDLLTTGNIRANLTTRGVITAIRLSGTAPGAGATVISGQGIKNVTLLAGTTGGIILASHGMGGDGNTADTENVNTTPAPAELSAVKQGSNWDGHVTSRTMVTAPGYYTATFTGGNVIGTHTIAAEFLGALVSGGSPYDTWASTNAPNTGNDPSADEDNDGVSNAVEFVLGGTSATNDLDKLPTTATNATEMTFTFVRDEVSVSAGVTLSIEVSNDLVNWNAGSSPYAVPDTATAGPPVQVVDNGDTHTVTLTVAKAPDIKKFARLKVIITP
jgi:hypothetical protein